MQIVIDIPEEMYKNIQSENFWLDSGLTLSNAYDFIKNGTPLPKGHGRIADVDEVIKCIKDVEGDDAIWAISLIEWACSKRTIIEADKESEDEG